MSQFFSRRRWLALGLALAGSARGQSNPAATGAATTASPSASPSPGRNEPVVIGQSAHLSGPLATTFLGVLAGQRLALTQFNARGGVAGRPVQLITLDDGYDVKRCVANVRQLIERERITALFGLASTPNVAAVLPLLAERQVPLVGVYGGSPSLRVQQHPYFFTTTASYRDEVLHMLRNQKTLQRERVALVYQNAAFGQLMRPVVDEAARELGMQVVARVPLEADGSNSVAAAASVAEARPQAVILMAFGPPIVPFIKAARQSVAAPLYAISIANAKALIEAMGDDARGLAITQVIPPPWRSQDALVRDFSAASTRAGTPADYEHFYGYLNLRILLEALKRAGRGVTPAKLVSTLEGMNRVDLGGYTLSFSAGNHHGSSYVDSTIVGPGGRFIR